MDVPTILVIEDDEHTRDFLATYLGSNGFTVHSAHDGATALEQVRALRPDLVILDIMLPGLGGLEVCRLIQQESDVYVLMLTARTDEIDKIVGLSIGADDYLTKPFSPRELLVRVQAILRRRRGAERARPAQAPAERAVLHFENLLVDAEMHEVWHKGGLVALTPREFSLLYALAEEPGRVLTREQLLERVWGRDFVGIDRVVDVHIGMLRRKLEEDPASPALIQTVRGIGYKFVGRRRAARETRR